MVGDLLRSRLWWGDGFGHNGLEHFCHYGAWPASAATSRAGTLQVATVRSETLLSEGCKRLGKQESADGAIQDMTITAKTWQAVVVSDGAA